MKKRFMYLLFLIFITSNLFANNRLDIKDVIANSKSITKAGYINAHDVLIDNLISVEYDTTGKYISYDDTYIKILDETGKNDNRILNLRYSKSYGMYDIKLIEIIKPDGHIKTIDIKANMDDQVEPSQASINIYNPNLRKITVQIPDLEIGDILHYYMVYNNKKARIEGEFSDFQFGQYTSPIAHMKYILKAPKSSPLKMFEIIDPVKGHYIKNVVKKDDKIIYTFEVNNAPQIISEPSMPALRRVVMRMLVSTLDDWRYVSRWYYNLTENHMDINREIIDRANELVKDKKTEMDTIEAVFYFVSRNIRYMGVTTETDRPGLEPHDVSYTFSTRTGVCRDKAALIVAMLRSVGVEANVVLIMVGPKLDKDVPMTFFNHAIAGAKLENGKDILMDPTDETSSVLFPAYEANMSYLIASLEGDTLKTSPPVSPDINKVEVKTNIDYKDGKFYCTSDIEFYGINNNAYRGYFLRLNRNRIEEFLKRILKEIAGDISLKSYEISPEDLLSSKENLRIKIEYIINDPIIGEDEYKMFNLPELSKTFGVYNWALGNVNLSKRKYPLKTRYTASVNENINLNYNNRTKKLNVELMPDLLYIDKDGYTFRADYKKIGNRITFSKYAALNKLEYYPDEYDNLKKHLRLVENYNKKYIIIKE